MRILHTADWHLGKTIEGRDRQTEQEQCIGEICDIAEQEGVDLVLIAGDVFQSPNPSAAAEELFYNALDRLADHGRRGVVVIAGNHDSPERLCAAQPLADRLGITLVGLPVDELQPWSGTAAKVRRVACGPSWLELAVPNCEHNAVIIALPYPSEGRLRRLVAQSLAESALQQGYHDWIAGTMRQLSAHYRTDTVNLATSHIYVKGGIESGLDSETPIQQIGGAYAVDPAVFPPGAQYVALGHLHRPQAVAGHAAPIRYAGSPLAYSFAETGYTKSVVLADIKPGKAAVIREIPLSAPKPLVRWQAKNGLAEVLGWIEAGRDENAWIELEIHVDALLKGQDIHNLHSLRPGIVNIHPVLSRVGAAESSRPALAHLSLDQLFTRFYERQRGAEPDEALVRLFLELAGTEEKPVPESGEETV